VSHAIADLNKKLERAVTAREVAQHLKWKSSLVYKYAKSAVRHRLVQHESGTREKNVKRLLACDRAATGFLPSPRKVFKSNPEIGKQVKYIDPFTGEEVVLRRKRSR
jgi:hypothetical protein